ncbi:MAG: hypothetical protein WCI72_00295 [archaeon]
MTLDDLVRESLEGIRIEEKATGELVLTSEKLDAIYKAYTPSGASFFREVRNLLASKPPEEKIKHLVAKNLCQYLTHKHSASDSEKEKEQLSRLKIAFEDYHDIKINGVIVNYDNVHRPNFLSRHAGLIAGLGLCLAKDVVPGMEHFPTYAIFATMLGTDIYFRNKSKGQKVDFPTPTIEEIKRDINRLSAQYRVAKQNVEEDESKEITSDQLEELLADLPKEIVQQVKETMRQMGDKKFEIRVKKSKPEEYCPEKVEQMKEEVDRYAQKYCPTCDLEKIVIEVTKMPAGSAGGISPFRKNVIKVSRDHLEGEIRDFYRIYAHELAHRDGVSVEGMADYQAMQIISDMQADFPKHGHEFELKDTLLTAAAHTYVLERKKELRKRKSVGSHLHDVLSYNVQNIASCFLRRKKVSSLSVGVNQELYDELIKLGTPQDVADKVFECYDNLSLRNQMFFGAQNLLKKDGFMGRYTKDLYRVMKHKGKI